MKQTPLLNLLNMQPATAAPRSGPSSGAAREEFSQALSAVGPAARQAARSDQQRGDHARVNPAPASTPDRPEHPVGRTKENSAGGVSDTGLSHQATAAQLPEEIQLDDDLMAAWHSLDAAEQQQFLQDLNQLLRQLEQGDLDPLAALQALQQLLQTFELPLDGSQLADKITDTLALEGNGDQVDALAQQLQQLSRRLETAALASESSPAPDMAVAPLAVSPPPATGNPRNQAIPESSAPVKMAEPTPSPVTAVVIEAPDETELDSERVLASPLGELKKGQSLSPELLSLAGKSFTLTSASLEGQGLAERTPLTAVAGGSVNAAPLVAAPVPSERGFTVQTMVNTLVGQPGWGQEVGQRVSWLARQNIAEAQLRLDPPDLGPVHVKITVQNDQAQVVFTTHTPGVREALDQSAQRLRELFAEQGLDLVNVDVSDQSQAGSDQAEAGQDSGVIGLMDDERDDQQPELVMEGRLSMVDHYA